MRGSGGMGSVGAGEIPCWAEGTGDIGWVGVGGGLGGGIVAALDDEVGDLARDEGGSGEREEGVRWGGEEGGELGGS